MTQFGGGGSKEDEYAEQPALDWLRELGWEVGSGPDLGPDGVAPERETWVDVVLIDRLRHAVTGLNPDLPADAVEFVVQQVLTSTSPDVVADHMSFHELLVGMVPVTYLDRKGLERADRAKLVDFDDPTNNEFLALNQFTIISGTKNRRPDILLFVNGIPLAQVELKNPADEHATPEAAAVQVAHYIDTIPALYRFVDVIGVSDLLQARVGTITSPAEHFADWKTMDPADSEGRPALEVMLRGAFAPAVLLDLVRNFTLFETNRGKVIEIMAKYHQVDAVNRAVEATAEAMTGDGRAGVVWHTQGSGKSYSMLFYAQKLRRDPRFANPTIVCVTDRIDLDDQLMETFKRQTALAQSVFQADEISGSLDGLHELLDRPAGGVIFTTIQKFVPGQHEDDMPVLSERENVIVISDEAHRSQYAEFARNLRKALPNATRIGFTGTPIETDRKSTSLTFGDYISIYDIGRAVEDKATVPIFYESRMVPLEINDEEKVAEVEEFLASEDAEAVNKLITREAKLERVVGSDARIENVALDIADHFQSRERLNEGKAMVVGMSRPICVKLANRLKELLGNDAVTCVVTAAATEPELNRYRRSKAEMKQVAEDFKDPSNPLKVVVVRDMWLTGFDVPALHTLYVDKPMRDHGLLQAIARVNRVFRDKPGGFVVDYIGIGEDLRKALPAYADKDVENVTVPKSHVLRLLREKHEILCDFFPGIDWQGRDKLPATEGATLLASAHAAVVEDEETSRRYLTEQAIFSKLLALSNPDPEVDPLLEDAVFFADIARSVRKYTPPEGEASQEAEQAVRQVMSEGLAAGEIVDIFGLAGEDRPEISVLSDEFLDGIEKKLNEEPSLTVAFLKKVLNDEIKARGKRNQMQAKLFGEELEKALARYRNRQITGTEVIKTLIELAKQVRESGHRHEEMGLSDEELAFYDALAGSSEDVVADPKIAEIARELVTGIRGDLTVDWTTHESREAAVRRKIKRLLRNHKYLPATAPRKSSGKPMDLDRVTDLVLEQARVLYRKWPDLDVDL